MTKNQQAVIVRLHLEIMDLTRDYEAALKKMQEKNTEFRKYIEHLVDGSD